MAVKLTDICSEYYRLPRISRRRLLSEPPHAAENVPHLWSFARNSLTLQRVNHNNRLYRMNAVSMNNLWNYLQGLSLTASNRKWLAERLIETPEKAVMSDDEIKEGLAEAFVQLEEVKAGTRKTRRAEELLYEL